MNRILVLTFVAALLLTTPALAEPVEVTQQAKAANADFLLRVTPPSPPAAVCLVDTGVNANPDTSQVERHSVMGRDGSDLSPSLHGTRLAMLLAAPSNGFGMVGFWPSARVVSVQANVAGQDGLTPEDYVAGVDRCLTLAPSRQIKVIVLAASSETPLTADERLMWDDVAGKAESRNVNLVVAAGNHAGRSLGAPANAGGALTVGATDPTSGTACAIGAIGAQLAAPGCALDAADPITGQPAVGQQGTSAAAAIVAASLAALRTWRPDLSAAAAEQLVRETAAGSRLNLGAAFVAAGLEVPQPPVPSATPTPTASSTPSPQPTPQGKTRLAKPKVATRFARRVLTVTTSNRPKGARVLVQVYARDAKNRLRRVARREMRSASVRVRLQRWTQVKVQFLDPTGGQLSSSVTVVTRRR